jgi:hypothetical protein
VPSGKGLKTNAGLDPCAVLSFLSGHSAMTLIRDPQELV